MDTTLPKISIVTPSFNQSRFLEATIQSVLLQGYPNLEYIIIDGGSTDSSREIIKKYHTHLSFWRSEPDAGQYDAINQGFAHATGEIMAWLNSDDLYFPWTLATVASIMTRFPEIAWLTTMTPCFFDASGICTGVQPLPGFSREAFLDGRYVPWGNNRIGWIQQESTFWRRELWENIGGKISEETGLAGDFDLWCRFYEVTELYGTPCLLAGFRSHAQQRSVQSQAYRDEALASLERMRSKQHWVKTPPEDYWARKIGLQHLPMIGKHFPAAPKRYAGKKIVRSMSETSEMSWKIETIEFVAYDE
ncbi:glycosyl transferase family 2 [Candidatus Moduliflexus flocculans]|uniref:Glycosyl transferase family 2 n=1 Tax=Candidatus Moduliflexus flocculans TaxID=1499966 RepID=A0A0S6VSU9_9BACT|nr:glycosyl transferase family 2 [Candidatus Moduliflexus flocculans]